MFSIGICNAFIHLDQCMHDVKGDVNDLKGEMKGMRADFKKHMKRYNNALVRVLGDGEA